MSMFNFRRNYYSLLNPLLVSSSLIFSVIVMSGCIATRPIQFNIDSTPQGAVVLYSVTLPNGVSSPWIFLGHTPYIEMTQMDPKHLNNNRATFTFRAIKEGYFEQTRAISVQLIRRELKSKGAVYWNPKLVPVR